MAIYEGLWDCPVCLAKGIRGSARECAGCGAPRTSDVEFYLPKDTSAITDAAEIAKAKSGPDWHCDRCGGDNTALTLGCEGCGAPKSEHFREVKDYSETHVPRVSVSVSATSPLPPELPQTPSSVRGMSRLRRAWKPPIIGIIAIVLGIGFLFFKTKERPLEVVGFRWERTIAIEVHRTVSEEDWSVPVGGRETREWRAIHHYDRVIDRYESVPVSERVQVGTEEYTCGKRSLGNGYFEDIKCRRPIYQNTTRIEKHPIYRDDPVWRTRYAYDIERWVPQRTDRARGIDQSPVWPSVSLAQNERKSGATELYVVMFRDEKGKNYEEQYPEQQWRGFALRERCIGVFNGFGVLREVRQGQS